MENFKLKDKKAINSLLYVVGSLIKADSHKVYKILYFADQKHLVKYGRPIIGDTYNKLEYGPVPSYLRNIVDANIEEYNESIAKFNGYFLKALDKPNLDYLSESDIECINESIRENKDLDFGTLTDKSHDEAYEKSIWVIDYHDIAKAGGADTSTLSFIRNQILNDNIELS